MITVTLDDRALKPASIVSRARRHSPKGYVKNRARTLARFADAKPLLDTGQLRNSIIRRHVAGGVGGA